MVSRTSRFSVEQGAAGQTMSLGADPRLVQGVAGSNGQLQAQIGDRQVNATVVVQDDRRVVFFEGRAWPLDTAAAPAGGW